MDYSRNAPTRISLIYNILYTKTISITIGFSIIARTFIMNSDALSVTVVFPRISDGADGDAGNGFI